ncbi:MAG: hypothetical protein RL177_1189 [Bacteroidota bacterium]
MQSLRLLLIGLASLAVLSCNSAKKAYDQGDYEQAVRLSVAKLKEDPDNRNARRVLVQAYPKAVETNLAEVRAFAELDDPLRWEPITRAYNRLNVLQQRLARCPVCDDLLPERRLYVDEWNDARMRAAEVRYRMGVTELRGTTRESAKLALEHFMLVEQFEPDFKDTRTLMDEALERATLHVVIREMPEQQRAFQPIQDAFQQELMDRLTQSTRRSLVRFYSQQEAESQPPPFLDHEISLVFESFSVGNVVFDRTTETVTSADSVKIGDARIDGQTVPVYNRVTARYTQISKTVLGGGQLLLKITDAASGRVVMQERFDGEYQWVHRWATFNGDERALNAEQKRLTQLREAVPPPPELIFEEFTRPILANLSERMRRFYAQQ